MPGDEGHDPQGAMRAALRLLTGRGYTRLELERRLRRRFDAAASAEAIARCARCGYLQEDRAAGERIDALLRRGFGPHRIQRDLEASGIGQEAAARLLAERLPPGGEMTLARRLIEKRRAAGRGDGGELQARARLYRYLLQRGFSCEAAGEAVADDLG
jgi:regulatory protein